MAPPAKVNYLTNKELLSEIHKSKCSYSYFIDPKFSAYDAIVSSLDEITPELIAATRESKAKKMMQAAKQAAKDSGLKNHQIKIQEIDPESIPVEDLVWRLMTFEHIPLDAERVKKPKSIADNHVKLLFPPFKHYILEDGEPKEVGRSHWRDALDNGQFSQDHGKISKRLALMFMKLVERYSQRGNWRGYCVDEQTEALTNRGWCNIDEITTDDKILSYDNGTLKWSKIKSIYQSDYDGLMHKITNVGTDMLVTPNHKLVTERGLVKAEYLLESDRVILMGSAEVGSEKIVYSDALVELVGWIVTEGCYEYLKADSSLRRITIYQNVGEHADRIRNCLTALGYQFSEAVRGIEKKNICFAIGRADSRRLAAIVPNKNLTMAFICSLSQNQRELLINTMIDGDGWRDGQKMRYVQKDKHHIDMFQALCALSGKRSNTHYRETTAFGKPTSNYTMNIFSPRRNNTRGECLNFHGGKRSGRNHPGVGKLYHPNEPTTPYKGRVWCPETEYGCFMARRNGTVYLTGNTYVDEMRSQALLQLSLVGLQFDESRSDNPFAYYTVTVSNAFTRVLNLEKRNQNIRDDMLVMHGVTPSMTRQIDNSLAQRAAANGEIPEAKKPARRGGFGRKKVDIVQETDIPEEQHPDPQIERDARHARIKAAGYDPQEVWNASNTQFPRPGTGFTAK